jgi:hypothetical protein
MPRRAALVLATLVGAACSSKTKAPPKPSRIPIVPDTIQLGEIGLGLAVDLRALDVDRLGGFIPDSLGCTRELLTSAHVGVITDGSDIWEGHVTGLDEATTRACLGKLGPVFGFDLHHTDHGDEVSLPGNPLLISWHGDDMSITQAGHARRVGAVPVVIDELLAHVPRDAKAWMVSSGFPQFKIRSVTAWLETDAATWTFTVNAESIEQGAARPWMEHVVAGFEAAATAKGAHLDERWFAIESTPTTAKLVATIPIAALAPK